MVRARPRAGPDRMTTTARTTHARPRSEINLAPQDGLPPRRRPLPARCQRRRTPHRRDGRRRVDLLHRLGLDNRFDHRRRNHVDDFFALDAAELLIIDDDFDVLDGAGTPQGLERPTDQVDREGLTDPETDAGEEGGGGREREDVPQGEARRDGDESERDEGESPRREQSRRDRKRKGYEGQA